MSAAKKYILDTSFIFAIITGIDPHNELARGTLIKAINSDGEILIPLPVVAEVAVGVGYKNTNHLINYLSAKVDQPLIDDLKYCDTLPLNSRRKLKANDCLILGSVRRNKATLLTFDKYLKRVANK